MDNRSRLRDEVTVSSALCLSALADEPGAQAEQSLSAASHLVDAAERTLHQLVTDARASGMTWAAVGDSLGISRQAAQKRFGGQVPQKVTRDLPSAPPELVELAEGLLDDAVSGRFDRIEQHASAHLRKLAGAAGLARSFEPLATMYGDFVSRAEPQVQLIGTVVYVSAIEQRTVKPARAEVTLAADGTLLGLSYLDIDSA